MSKRGTAAQAVDEDQERLDAWIARVKRLRAMSDAAHREMMLELERGEADTEMWAHTGFGFDQFIEAVGLAKASEYRAWRRGNEALTAAVGEGRAAAVSFHTVKAAASITSSAEALEVVEHDEAFRASNGVPASQTAAKSIVRQIKIVGAATRNRMKSQYELERELEVARAKIAALTEENKTLRAALRAARRAKGGEAKIPEAPAS